MSREPLEYESQATKKPHTGPLTLGLLALLLYPFCCGGIVMEFSAMNSGMMQVVDPVDRLLRETFLWGLTIYPLVYGVAAGISHVLYTNDRPLGARRAAQAPLIYLIVILLCAAGAAVYEHQ